MDTRKLIFEEFMNSAGVSIDTRTIHANQIFFAISGHRFDGHDYIDEALSKGASHVIIDDKRYAHLAKSTLVDNTIRSLQDLAVDYRKTFNIPFLGITGSNGKTTTKELIHSVLSTSCKVHATKGNLNNHLGVPLTILSIPRQTDIAIVEMGANHSGEILDLCQIANPNLGLLTNIGKAHIGEFGSFENIKITKLSLLQFVAEHEGIIFVNTEDSNISSAQFDSGVTQIFYNKSKIIHSSLPIVQIDFHQSEFFNEGTIILQEESFPFKSNLPGEFNKINIIAAIAVGYHFNVNFNEIARAVQNYLPQNNRSQILSIGNNKIILDAYNANPDSMRLAVHEIINSGNLAKIVILGDMLELGDYSEEEHNNILDMLEASDINKVILVGKLFPQRPDFEYYKDWQELMAHWNWKDINGSIVLIKGSRSLKLENIVSDYL